MVRFSGSVAVVTSNVLDPVRMMGSCGRTSRNRSTGWIFRLIFGRLVVHRQDQPGTDRVEQCGDLGEVDRRRPTGGNEHDLRAAQWS